MELKEEHCRWAITRFRDFEDVCVVERKDLSDLVRSFTVERPVFVARLRQMAEYPHCLLVVSAALSQVKSPYPHSIVNPNQITQSLIAVLAGLRVPFVGAETHDGRGSRPVSISGAP